MKRMVALLKPEQWDDLKALSLKSGMAIGEIVRRALTEYLKKQK